MIGNLLSKLSFKISLTVPPTDSITKWQYAVLIFFIFFSCFYGLSSYAIVDMNEGLYAEIAREMMSSGNYIVPFLNGVPYLEKPPLFYWLLAISYHIFGVGTFAARFVPSTVTALTCIALFYVGKKLQTPRIGWIAALILLTSSIFIVIGRVVFFDMLLTFLMTCTLFAFYFWYTLNNRSYLYLSYFFLALAVLTKGFMAIALVALIAFAFLWFVKAEKQRYIDLFDKKAIILFLIIMVPWHLLAMVMQPGFTWEYFINNQLLRFFNMRIPHDYHTGPIYYYAPRMIIYLLPWSALLPLLIPWPMKIKRPFSPLPSLLWLWLIIMFVFFSLSGDKGDYYLVLATPPFAYLIAQKIDEYFSTDKARWLSLVFIAISWLMVVACFIGFVFYMGTKEQYLNRDFSHTIPYTLYNSMLFLTLFLIIYAAIGTYICYKNTHRPILPFLLLTGLIIPCLLFFLSVKVITQRAFSQIALAEYVKTQYEHRPVYFYQDFETASSFIFYNRERSGIVDSHSNDLYFGSQSKQAAGWFITTPEFMTLAKQQSVYLLISVKKYDDFQKIPGASDFCIVQRNGFEYLLSNAAEDCKPIVGVGTEKQLNTEKILSNPGNSTIHF